MIEFENITIAHKGSSPLLSRQSAVIPSGTLTALTGRNGSGKSTLLRAICGTQPPESGAVLIGATKVNPASVTPSVLASMMSLVTTERLRVRHMTVRQLVAMGRAPLSGLFGTLHAEDYRVVDRAIERVGLGALASREVDSLSDGEHQRAMLARALAQDTPIILLDEPTGFLDVPNRRSVTNLLASLAHEEGKTIVYSTHELELALERADLILHLAPPRLVLLPPEQMSADPLFAALRAPE